MMISVITKKVSSGVLSGHLSKYHFKLRSLGQKGMTMIEILITLGIMASVMAFGASVLGAPERDMRDATANMIRVIRFVYNQAALNNEYYRVVFDMNDNKYFAESSSTPFYVIHDNDEIEQIRIRNEEDAKDHTSLGQDEAETTDISGLGGSFAEAENDLLEIYPMPGKVRIRDVFVEHQEDILEEGRAYLYVFPKGQAEFAVIHLEGADEDNVMTLVVNPLTADVTVSEEDLNYSSLLNRLSY